MLTEATDGLTTASGTFTAGASAQLIALGTDERSGLSVSLDTAATAPVYLLLGTGTASAINFHIALAAGGNWDGRISGSVWRGAVQFFSTAAGKVGVVETL